MDYECYRYVDDYFFFYNDDTIRTEAELLFQSNLKEFKLSLSQEKSKVIDRPFVTDITKAKIALDDLLNDAVKLYTEEPEEDLPPEEEIEQAEQDLSEEQAEQIVKVDSQKALKSIESKIYFRLNATDFNKRFKIIVSTNGVDSKDILNYTISRLAIRLERSLKIFDQYYKTISLTLNSYELSGLHEKAERKRRQLESDISKYLFNILDVVFFLYANSKRINTTLKLIQILNIIRIYLDNDYTIETNQKKAIVRRFTEYAREIVFKKIRDEISMVLQTAPMDENVQLETLYFLIILRSMNNKYHLTNQEIEKYLKIEYKDDGSVSAFPKLNMLAVTILIYYFGNIDQYKELKKILIDCTLKLIEDVPVNRRKISAEFVIFALDVAACPYIDKEVRVDILQKVGVSRSEGDAIVEYMKHQKFMFTKWTGIDITKELNAKISQEVYS